MDDATRTVLAALTDDQRWAMRHAVVEWITVATREGYAPICNWSNATAEVHHSALLHRLLDGKAPLPAKPPLRNSYPDYEAVEGGQQ